VIGKCLKMAVGYNETLQSVWEQTMYFFFRARWSLRSMLALVAFAGLLIGADRLWRRAEHYRRQAALCAYFELQSQMYASDAEKWDETTEEEKEEKRATIAANLAEARESARLKKIYGRIARHPWEVLPFDTPTSVNAWDLGSVLTSDLEEMVAELGSTRDIQ